jgi:hypothetical protein
VGELRWALPCSDDERDIIENLAQCLERLWSGGGEYGVYTVAIERDRLRPALLAFMRQCQKGAAQ